MRTKLRRPRAKSCLWMVLFLLLLGAIGIRQYSLRGNGLHGNQPPYSGPRWQRDQEEQVMEAIFRYQIRENRDKQQLCFLSVHQAAPSRTLMQRFRDLPFVLPLSSRFQYSTGDYKDKTTGQSGLHFWIDRINWDSDTEVRAEGGGAAAVRAGDAGRFTAHWEHGTWQVTYAPQVRY